MTEITNQLMLVRKIIAIIHTKPKHTVSTKFTDSMLEGRDRPYIQ